MRVEITLAHENGMRTSHHYTVPNDNNVQLVCTNHNNNKRSVYPIVRVPNRPTVGQSSVISPHYRRSGAAPGPFICSEYMAKRLRDQTAGVVTQPNILISSSPCVTSSCYNPSILLNSGYPFTESGKGVVGREQQPLKHGPYTCKKCGDVFEISQALAAHMNTHYLLEETVEETSVRQAIKYKRKRVNNQPRMEPSSSSTTVPDQSHLGIMHAAAQDVCKESGENSSENKAHDLEKGFNTL